MRTDLHDASKTCGGTSPQIGHALYDFEKQCLRVLHCTAKALANSPGGLRFKAGTRPWLEAITPPSPHRSLSPQQGA